MPSQWSRNDLDPARRSAKLIIDADGYAPAPRGTDFMALGIVFLSYGTSTLVAAAGTMQNDRMPLVVADFTITACDPSPGNDTTTKAAHGLETGDGPFKPTTTAGGFVAGTPYYPIYVNDNVISWATSLLNAYAGVKLDITADVTGMVFQDVQGQPIPTDNTRRGIDGRFTYIATQPESDTACCEVGLYVEGPGFRFKNGGGTFTSIAMANTEGSGILEGSTTRDDALRLALRTLISWFTKDSGGNYVVRDLANSKDSHSFTVTPSGKTALIIIDPT